MDARQEFFVERVNGAVDTQSHLGGENRAGKEIVVHIFYPKAFPPVDCDKTDDINLDNARIAIPDEQVVRVKDETGEHAFDGESMGCVIYTVTGVIRADPAQDGA